MPGTGNVGVYEPYNDLRLYPGIHLSADRRRALDEDAIEPDDLSNEDIIYKLSRMVTGTMYTVMELVEERLGEEQARELMVEWGRRRARENLRKWMGRRGLEKLTPELWARFQDYRHLISGPVHAPSFIKYEGDSDLVLGSHGMPVPRWAARWDDELLRSCGGWDVRGICRRLS